MSQQEQEAGLNWAKLCQSTGIDVTGHGTNKIVVKLAWVGSQWIKEMI